MARLSSRRSVGQNGPSPAQVQSDFYAETAEQYDEQFAHNDDFHEAGLEFISALVSGYGFTSLLDVGSGTGRALRYLHERHEGVEMKGIEPVRALIRQGESAGLPPGLVVEGSGYELPFEDDSFDVVCEFAVLHHVEDPNRIVAEMTRVARRAVFLSDENRFGQGKQWRRKLKFALYEGGLWPLATRLRNGGRSYILNDLDGRVSYSYSLYDSLPTLAEWADRCFFLPLEPGPASRFHPLFDVQHLLLAGLKSPPSA